MPFPLVDADCEGSNANGCGQVWEVLEISQLFLSTGPTPVDVVLHNFFKIVKRAFAVEAGPGFVRRMLWMCVATLHGARDKSVSCFMWEFSTIRKVLGKARRQEVKPKARPDRLKSPV